MGVFLYSNDIILKIFKSKIGLKMVVESKLFKLKGWFSISEAAKRLTTSLFEEVTKVDIFRLALDKHLVLSLRANQKFPVKKTTIKHCSLREMFPYLSKADDPINQYFKFTDKQIDEKETRFMTEEKVVYMGPGCWDLSMIGGETIGIENIYNRLREFKESDLVSIDGCFVYDFEKNLYQIQDYNKEMNFFYPASSLPNDIEIVVRRENIEKFEQLLLQNEDEINFEQSKQLIAFILKALKEKGSKSWNQDDLSTYISEELPYYGLGKTKINKFFLSVIN